MTGKRVLVTGGAGFIGSHLVEELLKRGREVAVVDDLSAGKLEYLEGVMDHPNMDFHKLDILRTEELKEFMGGVEVVYHLAANPEVRIGESDTWIHIEQNLLATRSVLEAMKDSGRARTILFTSTSAVYGDAEVIPTPETYAPLFPISHYGASKLGAEALLSSYSHYFGFHSLIFRFANCVGPRLTHGVIYDFVNKLRRNPQELEILGDGTQRKSYVHVKDCVEAMLVAEKRRSRQVDVFNIGSDDWVDVKRIAEIVVEAMGLEGVRFKYRKVTEDGRGWKGDVKFMRLDNSKIKSLGWRPTFTSEEAVRETALYVASLQ
ncbi:MAG: GDP-mannose 4,6-dehydratase [Thermoplasmata archaeon]|nr:GDP-mannose 4,6-dehydratase [Thermoplasmata archaeon]